VRSCSALRGRMKWQKFYCLYFLLFCRRIACELDASIFVIENSWQKASRLLNALFFCYESACVKSALTSKLSLCFTRSEISEVMIYFTKFFLFDKFDRKPDNKEFFAKNSLLSGFLSNLSKRKNFVK
jgi:hypothetical protein